MRILLMLPVVFGIVGGLHYYLWARFVRDPAWPEPWQRVLTVLLVALAVLLPAGMMLGRVLNVRAVAWAAFIWMGVMFLLFVGAAMSEVVRVPLMLANPDRRQLFARVFALGVGALGAGASGFGLARALQALGVKEVQVKLTKLPGHADGLVIAQLTDIHVGPTIGKDFVEAMVEKTNALNPDLICITGDLVDGSVEQLREHTAPLAKLKAKYGVFFVTGNHEYYSGADAWTAEVERLGIIVLRNEHQQAGPIDIVGVNDWTADHDLPQALKGRDASRPSVLMAHQPRAVTQAAEHGVCLQISGHTHAGQIWPWGYAVKLQAPWVQGLYREKDTQIYVSAGTGYWGPPLRVGTRAEITRIVLRAEQTSGVTEG